ncbi:MAG TPA: hypothetical protein VFP98_09545, partial [Candidatus Polarisedimenticolia bacterium]|nr:hypothetical protein [Candidatus Polarisedimenticolia bacterium]
MKKSSLADFDVREKAGAISVALLIWLVVTLLFAFLVNLPRRARLAAAQTQVEDLNQRIFRAGRDIAR